MQQLGKGLEQDMYLNYDNSGDDNNKQIILNIVRQQ